MSDIVLINPPLREDTGLDIRMNPPLGILYLASVLERKYSTTIIDMCAKDHTWKNVRERISIENPNCVLITATSLSFPSLVKVVEICKELENKSVIRHHIHTIIGGAHVSAIPSEALNESGADCAIVGEGELVVEDVIKNNKTGIVNGQALENLDDIDINWDLLEPRIGDLRYYTGNDPIFNRPEANMLWSRGCPHRCVFCANTIYQHRAIKFRSKESICKELEMLRTKYRIRGIFEYSDELIGCNMKQTNWLMDVCDEIVKRGLNDITFKAQGRCNPLCVTNELLKKMNSAGFKALMLGIESGSQRVLDTIKKDITIDDIETVVKRVAENGIKVWAFLMVGNASDDYIETEEDCEHTVELVKRLKPYISYRHVTIATPYVGSELYRIAKENRWIINDDYRKWNAHNSILSYPHFSSNRLNYWVNQILKV